MESLIGMKFMRKGGNLGKYNSLKNCTHHLQIFQSKLRIAAYGIGFSGNLCERIANICTEREIEKRTNYYKEL